MKKNAILTLCCFFLFAIVAMLTLAALKPGACMQGYWQKARTPLAAGAKPKIAAPARAADPRNTPGPLPRVGPQVWHPEVAKTAPAAPRMAVDEPKVPSEAARRAETQQAVSATPHDQPPAASTPKLQHDASAVPPGNRPVQTVPGASDAAPPSWEDLRALLNTIGQYEVYP